MPTPSPRSAASQSLIDAVHRDLAELEAADAAIAAGLAKRREQRRVSSVFTLRLDPGEFEALERRAAALGMKPSVLARNFIRIGVSGRLDLRLQQTADRLARDLADLQEALTARSVGFSEC
ncbi:MAG TPA: hypothetical protein VHC23_00080 [Jatrophihabitans sp.]|jgi:hypothetical protein|nr:hypothetical protein [Jatrophihabitans sp.]